ncbi:dihydrofolate reductase [Weeksellaceae bacterium TAE3-ERU29]|nr:dihydrofolate reductase [Weeksellaceae bacterium TAE3-ERU29]
MKNFKLISIVAIAKNNVIGKDGQLIWHIPEDLKRFKNLTLGHPMIMGRKTFESFPKPLPGRIHIVLSSTPKEDRENIIWVDSIEKAIAKAKELDNEKAFIIGGGNIYKQTMNLVDELEITKIDAYFEGDTFFPEIDKNIFKLKKSEKIDIGKDFDISYNRYLKK